MHSVRGRRYIAGTASCSMAKGNGDEGRSVRGSCGVASDGGIIPTPLMDRGAPKQCGGGAEERLEGSDLSRSRKEVSGPYRRPGCMNGGWREAARRG